MGTRAVRAAQGADPQADVSGGDSGGDRQQGDRPRNPRGGSQKRDSQVLWGRHYPEAQAARETEGRQTAYEADRHGRGAPGGVPGGAQGRALREIMSGKKRSVFREYVEAGIWAAVLTLFLRAFVIQAFRIPSESMLDTLLV